MYKVTCPICGRTRTVKVLTSSVLCRSCARKKSIQDGTIQYPTKLCKFCNQPFVPNSNKQIYCKRTHYRICPVCGKTYIEDNVENLKKPPVACSYECRVKLTQSTSIEKYGCIAPGNSYEAREKSKQTMMQKYGVEYAMQDKSIREKARKSLKNLYGVDNASKCPEIVSKRLQTNLEKYGNYLGPNLTSKSKVNEKFGEILTQNEIQWTDEFRLENRIFDFKVGCTLIEINPTYTHNFIGNSRYPGLDKYYHRDKTNLARKNGYNCINIWDWDNVDKIVSTMYNKIEIDSSEFEVYRLTNSATDKFLNQNSYLGSRRGHLLCLGLVKDNEIYQVMTFGKPSYDKSYCAQIYRMCTKPGYSIVGGYDLLSKAATEFGLFNIVAYADLSKSDGLEYKNLGMKFVRNTQPRLIWSKNSDFINSALIQSGKSIYHSEEDLLKDGWLPVYDCGQAVYEFR